MRSLLAALFLAGGALALPACGPAEVDVGYGAGYYGYAPDYYYGGYPGYYGGPYYRPGIVVGRPFGHERFERHEGFEHGRREAFEHRGFEHHEAPRTFGHAPAPHFAGPPPGGHRH